MDEIENSIVVTLFTNLKIVAYVKVVACFAILIYDTIITFDQEYRYIWQRKWHFLEILYFCIRYTPFIDTTIAVYKRLDPTFSKCDGLGTFTTIFSGFGVGLSELILMIRTYALYNSSRRILVFFVVLWLSVGGVSFWAITRWTHSADSYVQIFPPEATTSVTCYLGRASNIGLVCYLSLLAGETVIVLMTTWKALSTWWTTAHELSFKTSPLIVSLHRDGILFYFCILPFTIVNVIAVLRLPEGLLLIADTPLRIVHSILACRLVLHVRCIADTERAGGVEFLKDVEKSGWQESAGRRILSAIQQV
ncbi:hypothetical protein PM082_013659 [Marasmius tenuissimus]|nr:hypothetical protein PM082_013659 [Marasmius tenuissimus]